MPTRTISFYCPSALTSAGWLDNVVIEATDGEIARIVQTTTAPPNCHRLGGPVIPGLTNVHSHAFQRAMAGLAEQRASRGDNFWVWRDAMYRFASILAPDDVEAIARLLYIELLLGGFTAVGEFHYLHHAAGGVAYQQPAEMSLRISAAAQAAGIRLCLLPVLYSRGGFDGRPLAEQQRRFVHDVDSYLKLLSSLKESSAHDDRLSTGIAFHSLRAVSAEQIRETLAATPTAAMPVHIHIAEQLQEVADCQAAHAARPIEWLLDQCPVDDRWCLIHATHVDSSELQAMAQRKVIVGLCPTTEANLGDGIFPALEFLSVGGKFGVGTDSHVNTSAAAELRLLEYGQRLVHRQRNLLAPVGGSVGASLYADAARNGAQCLGQRAGLIETGYACDLLVLRDNAPQLAGRAEDAILDTLVFAGSDRLIQDVIVGGRLVVENGQHPAHRAAAEDFSARMQRVAKQL